MQFLEFLNSKPASSAFGPEAIGAMPTTTNVELLAAKDDSWARDDDPSKCRFLVDGKSIKYVLVDDGVYPKYWVDKMHAGELEAPGFPPFPVGDWNVGRLSKDAAQTGGAPRFSRLEALALPEVGDAWHPTRIDYFDLLDHPSAARANAPKSSAEEKKLMLIAHPSFPGKTLLMKIADFPSELPRVEREIRAYKMLAGTGLTPEFLGHVTEAGRVVGFLLEWVEGADVPGPATLDACGDALRRLHAHGIYQGSIHAENFLCCNFNGSGGKVEGEKGKVLLVDFAVAKFEADDAEHKYTVRRQNRDFRGFDSSMFYLALPETSEEDFDTEGYESDAYSDWTPDDADDYIF